MHMQPYQVDELTFAWCYRVYYRWRTHRRQPRPDLTRLESQSLRELLEPYGIHLLEWNTDVIDMRTLVSLAPAESVSVAASKMKGRVSKWLSEHAIGQSSAKSLARGYFAITSGKPTADEINAYLDQQGEHHGYDDRPRPPVFVRSFDATPETESMLKTDHAITRIRFHIVMATSWRRGVFGQASAAEVSQRWLELQPELKIRLEKVSFVPDLVHLAVTLHPAASPAVVVTALMNAAQEVMWRQFDRDVIQAGVERFGQPSAHIGSFSDLTSAAISAYVARWERMDAE